MDNLVLDAVKTLQQETDFELKIQKDRNQTKEYLYFPKYKYSWQIEARKEVTITTFTRGLFRLDETSRDHTILVATYINDKFANLCRDNKINYIDLAGNSYINRSPVYIDIRGRKLSQEQKDMQLQKKLGRAFQPKGMKLVMMLLLENDLINQPMRVIAERAEIALGSVKLAIDDLIDQHYIVDKGKKGRVLTDRKQLLMKWVEAYPKNMRSKLTETRCMTANFLELTEETFLDSKALWGGEVAASKYTHFLSAKEGLLYADDDTKKKLLKRYRLLRLHPTNLNAHGVIKLVTPPVSIEKIKGSKEGIVNPLLVYAELLNSTDSRNLETAKRLYEEYLA